MIVTAHLAEGNRVAARRGGQQPEGIAAGHKRGGMCVQGQTAAGRLVEPHLGFEMTEPTPFQRRMDAFLSDLSGRLGVEVEKHKVGVNELALRYRFPDFDWEVWIYDDGANILSVNRDDRYELADYDSLEDLETALREDLRKALTRFSATT